MQMQGRWGWGHNFVTDDPRNNQSLIGCAIKCWPILDVYLVVLMCVAQAIIFDRSFELFEGVCDWILNCVGNL